MVLTYLRLSLKPRSSFIDQILKLVICWLRLCSVTITYGSVVFKAPILATQFAITSALVQTTTHRLGTTHQAQQDIAPTCFYQGFPGSWQFFFEVWRASQHSLKHSLSPTVCLNHVVIRKRLINTELYLTFPKYSDELVVVKSLLNILKFAYFNIVFYSSDICDLINHLIGMP